MIPATRETFKEWCLRKLGEPVIQVNVAVEQLEDRIDEALYKYYEGHSKALEETILLYDVTEADVNRQYIQLPDNVASVTDVYSPTSGTGVGSADWAISISELYSLTSLYRYGDMSYYYMNRMHLSLLKEFFTSAITYTYSEASNRLQILGGFRTFYEQGKPLAVRVAKKISGDTETVDSNGEHIGFNIWKDRWLQQYSVALIREQWAQNLSKYQNIQLLGGVTMSAEQMEAKAKEELQKLEEELVEKWQFPPRFFVG